MQSFFQQVLNILTSNPGILVYHTVIAFSIAAALSVSFYQWRSAGFPEARRATIGLGLLLLTRLALFGMSSLATQGIVLQIQPALDRVIALIDLVLVIWVWAFPRPSRMGDFSAILVGILTLAASAVGLVWWSGQKAGVSFIGSWADTISEIYALVLLGIGLLVLITHRPEGWGYGVGMLSVLALGYSANLIFPLGGNDYQGALRLAEMIAFPILLALPQRISEGVPYSHVSLSGSETDGSQIFGPGPKVLQAMLIQTTEETPVQVLPGLCRTLGEWLQGSLCLIAGADNHSERLVIEGGYDLSKERPIEKRIMEGNLAGVIANALRRGRSLRLPSSSTASDGKIIKAALGMEDAGPLLAVPISKADESTLARGIVVLSTRHSSGWTTDDQANLAGLVPVLAQILHHTDEVSKLREKVAQSGAGQQAIQTKHDQIQQENEDLLGQLESLRQQSIQEHSRAESLAALIASQEISQGTIARLEAEIKSLREDELLAQQSHTVDLQRLQGELNRAKDEAALLQAKLDTAGQSIASSVEGEPVSILPKPPAGNGTQSASGSEPSAAVSGDQAEVIASLAQELRQPMSSIVGYTDLLLSESAGILGALQRKFLERVKASTERMGGLIDDLVQTTFLGRNELVLKPESVDLNLIIDEAVAMTIAQIREKSILLRVDLPDQMPSIIADRDSLQQILIHLLQNASSITPMDGEIALSASTHFAPGNGDKTKDYLLLSVSDTGGGIPSDELPRVFSRLYRADNTLIQGVGDTGVGLSIVKTLVEAHEGRVWVDTEMGHGSTFSVLLPTTPSHLISTLQKGEA